MKDKMSFLSASIACKPSNKLYFQSKRARETAIAPPLFDIVGRATQLNSTMNATE